MKQYRIESSKHNGVDYLISYSTHVANIVHKENKIYVFGKYSSTTTRHINNVANELNYSIEQSTVLECLDKRDEINSEWKEGEDTKSKNYNA